MGTECLIWKAEFGKLNHKLNVRPGFDVANESIKSRRSIVQQQMEEMGISVIKLTDESTEEEEENESSRPPMEKRLSSMVLGKIPKSVMEEDEEEGGEASTGADNGNDAAEDAVEEGGN